MVSLNMYNHAFYRQSLFLINDIESFIDNGLYFVTDDTSKIKTLIKQAEGFALRYNLIVSYETFGFDVAIEFRIK